jgi:hypothetical protein
MRDYKTTRSVVLTVFVWLRSQRSLHLNVPPLSNGWHKAHGRWSLSLFQTRSFIIILFPGALRSNGVRFGRSYVRRTY